MKKDHQTTKFSGSILYVSSSPHGDPEGIVLDDGTFIKIPPHTLEQPDLFIKGAAVSGEGVVLTMSPNRVIHHAKLLQGKIVMANDSDEGGKEGPKKHPKPKASPKISARIVAMGTKPKGEIDRIILDDDTSVHVPKDLDLGKTKLTIGSHIEVTGEMREFKSSNRLLRFVKAEHIAQI